MRVKAASLLIFTLCCRTKACTTFTWLSFLRYSCFFSPLTNYHTHMIVDIESTELKLGPIQLFKKKKKKKKKKGGSIANMRAYCFMSFHN